MLCSRIRLSYIIKIFLLLSFFSFPLIFLGIQSFLSMPIMQASGVSLFCFAIGLLPIHLMMIEHIHVCFTESEIIFKKYLFFKKRYEYSDLQSYSFYQYVRPGLMHPKREEGIYLLFQNKKIYYLDKPNIANYQNIRNHITTHFSKEKEGNIYDNQAFLVWIIYILIAFGGGGLLLFLAK